MVVPDSTEDGHAHNAQPEFDVAAHQVIAVAFLRRP
jgi:hypothetical protein